MNATRPWRLEGVVQHYDWGSPTAIPGLLGSAPDGRPQAELWMGVHERGAAVVAGDGEPQALGERIAREPDAVLGRDVRDRFGATLPFLLKLLAADGPLSIQAHPDAAQARAGFDRENEAGLALDAWNRSYRDRHPKPELICAITPFRAMNRFRAPGEISEALGALGTPGLGPLREPLGTSDPSQALAGSFAAWMALRCPRCVAAEPCPTRDACAKREATVADAVSAASRRDGDPACAEVARLAESYPRDPGVLAPLYLHLVELAPGEAMFLPAGQPHAYLGGTAVELMASSDNVLRGGLTTKFVDVDELLRTLRFESGPPEVLTPEPVAEGRARYATPAREFALEVLTPRPGRNVAGGPGRGPRILLALHGAVRLETASDADPIDVPAGGALFLSDAVGAYSVSGDATVYVASVGDGNGAAEAP